jgi:phosphatidylserine/phosphatidylglycerophosphate/cardiolipin synthase-like enzyme
MSNCSGITEVLEDKLGKSEKFYVYIAYRDGCDQKLLELSQKYGKRCIVKQYTGNSWDERYHAKVIIIDNIYEISGAYNFTYNAKNNSWEDIVVLKGSDYPNNLCGGIPHLLTRSGQIKIHENFCKETMKENLLQNKTFLSKFFDLLNEVRKFWQTATESIDIWIYSFSDKSLAEKLIEFKNANQLQVKVVHDWDLSKKEKNTIVLDYLRDSGVSVHLACGLKSSGSMHLKIRLVLIVRTL